MSMAIETEDLRVKTRASQELVELARRYALEADSLADDDAQKELLEVRARELIQKADELTQEVSLETKTLGFSRGAFSRRDKF